MSLLLLGAGSSGEATLPTSAAWRLIAGTNTFSDLAGTVPQTTYAGAVKRWNDSQGGSVYFDQSVSNAWPFFDSNRPAVASVTAILASPWSTLASHNVSIDRANFAFFMISEKASLQGSFGAWAGFRFGTTAGNDVGTNFRLLYQKGDGTYLSGSVPATTSKGLFGVVGTATAIYLITNDAVDTFAADSGTVTSLPLFAVNTTTAQTTDLSIYEAVCYARGLTAGEITQVQNYAEGAGAAVMSSARSYNLAWHGDSIVYSNSSDANRGFAQLSIIDFLPYGKAYNLGQGGLLFSGLVPSGSSNGAQMQLFLDAAKYNVSCVSAGVNDINNSQTAAQIFTSATTYYRDRCWDGYDAHILTDILPNNFDETVRTTYNGLVAGTPAQVCDSYIQTSLDLVMGQPGQNSNTTYYSLGLHPTDAGHLRRYTLGWQPAIQAVLGLPKRVSGVTPAPGASSIVLSWTAVTGATSYKVYRSTTSFGQTTALASGIVTNSYTDSTAAAGTTYYYRVSAVNGTGEGYKSLEVTTAIKTVLVQDDFSGTNGTLLNGRTPSPTTAGNNWAANIHDFALDGSSHAIANNANSVELVDAGAADGTVSVEMTASSSDGFSGALAVRNQGFGVSGWLILLDATQNEVVLSESTGFAGTTRARAHIPVTVGVTYRLRATMSGSTIDVYVNDVLMCSYASATANQATATHGLWYSGADGSKASFGHFKMTA